MDVTQLLGSLSNEDMQKLQTAAAGLLKNMNETKQTQNADNTPAESVSSASPAENTAPASAGLNLTALASIGKVINAEDDRIRFIEALKPLLSSERQKKADEAEKMLRLMSTLPALKESGILNGLI